MTDRIKRIRIKLAERDLRRGMALTLEASARLKVLDRGPA